MAPAVSIILPVFNRLEYLRAAIESVHAQTFGDWQLIIADDGSGAATRSYLERFEAEPRTRLISLTHTGNPGSVRNAALRAATGKYVAFLDSDDAWLPTKLERQVAALRARPRCRWSYTRYAGIDAHGRTCALTAPGPWRSCEGAIVEQILTLEAKIATASVLADRLLVNEAGCFDEQQAMFEHYDLWLRLALRSDVVLIDEALTCVRVHGEHYSTHGVASLESRDRWLEKAYTLVAGAGVRSLVRELRVRVGVDLASARAETNRAAALDSLVRGCVHWWRHRRWWRGAARVSLKVAAPRWLLRSYRRHARTLARTSS